MLIKSKIGKLLWMEVAVVSLICILAFVTGTSGEVLLGDKDGKFVKFTGNIQLQYHHSDPDNDDGEDEVFFRRLQPGIEGTLYKDWIGRIVFDIGKAADDNEVNLKDVYLQYEGFDNVKITIGNSNLPFSSEMLTSSKNQNLVERTFVGDHDYGTPARSAGVKVSGNMAEKKIECAAMVAMAALDQDAKKLDFESPVNNEEDFNEGVIAGGRIDFHPLGYLKMEQGDFKREVKATFSLAAFTWANDDDNNTYTTNGVDTSTGGKKPDVDKVTGFEVSGAFRGAGFSVDAQYNIFNAETVDPAVTKGIYKKGETDLRNWAIEGGYMAVADKLEVVGGYESQDADGYAEKWTRTSVGLNYFIQKHDIKIQGTYRIGKNVNGVDGDDNDEIFIQTQYVF